MKYKPEDIKPKRYPDEKPINDLVWAYPDPYGDWRDYFYEDSGNVYPWDTRPIQWFIDIPGAPPELKPLAYPENKPEQDGMYWVHHVESNKWRRWHYISDSILVQYSWEDGIVDYFIPVRLDKENEMGKNDHPYDLIAGRVPIGIPPNISDLIDRQYKKDDEIEMKYLIEWSHKEGVTLHDGNLSKGEFEGICRCFLKEQGYEVTKRKPEIKACPNPECESEVYISNRSGAARIICNLCGYQSPVAYSESEAIRLHNLISGKESDDWISVKVRLPEKHGYYLWWDEREDKPYIEYYMIGKLPYPGLSHWQYLPGPPKE